MRYHLISFHQLFNNSNVADYHNKPASCAIVCLNVVDSCYNKIICPGYLIMSIYGIRNVSYVIIAGLYN